jgi:regulatory protein
MGTITSFRLCSKGRVEIFVDGQLALIVASSVAGNLGLAVGIEVNEARVTELRTLDRIETAFSIALNFISYRPRSEAEVRERLSRRGLADVAEQVTARLRAGKLLNDATFARLWTDDRSTFKPRGGRLLRQELMRKGVPADVVASALKNIDDGVNALVAGRKKARILAKCNRAEFGKRLSDYLARRGFEYETIRQTVDQLWREIEVERAADQP